MSFHIARQRSNVVRPLRVRFAAVPVKRDVHHLRRRGGNVLEIRAHPCQAEIIDRMPAGAKMDYDSRGSVVPVRRDGEGNGSGLANGRCLEAVDVADKIIPVHADSREAALSFPHRLRDVFSADTVPDEL